MASNTFKTRIRRQPDIGVELNDTYFSVYRSGATNINSGAITTVDFNATLYDFGPNYSLTDNTFTAPQSGLYIFMWSVSIDSIADGKEVFTELVTTQHTYRGNRIHSGSVGDIYSTGSVITPMKAGDTAYVTVFHDHGAARALVGAQTVDYFMGGRIA